MLYEDGQTGTFTFSKNPDGTPKAVVSTMAGGESVAKAVVIKGDTISFSRDIDVQALAGSVTYTARLVEDALKGTSDVKLGDMPIPPTPFRQPRPSNRSRSFSVEGSGSARFKLHCRLRRDSRQAAPAWRPHARGIHHREDDDEKDSHACSLRCWAVSFRLQAEVYG
jgi:hypothetical protein